MPNTVMPIAKRCNVCTPNKFLAPIESLIYLVLFRRRRTTAGRRGTFRYAQHGAFELFSITLHNQGCKRGDGCRYVHPDDPAWFTAKASDPPPPSFLWQEKEHSPSKLSRAPMRRFGNDREDEAYGPVRPPPPSYRSSPPRGDISSRSHTRRSRSPMSTSSRDPGLSKRVRSDPKSVPPIEPLLPPPPLPSLPELLKGNLGEPTIKEKEDVWLERVK